MVCALKVGVAERQEWADLANYHTVALWVVVTKQCTVPVRLFVDSNLPILSTHWAWCVTSGVAFLEMGKIMARLWRPVGGESVGDGDKKVKGISGGRLGLCS
jgi:hypothetical protein